MNYYLFFALIFVCVCANPFMHKSNKNNAFIRETLREEPQVIANLAPLPCSFAVKGEAEVKKRDGSQTFYCDVLFAKSSEYMAVHSINCTNGMNYTFVVRGDHSFKYDDHTIVPVAHANKTTIGCRFDYFTAPDFKAETIISKEFELLRDTEYESYTIEHVDKEVYYVLTKNDAELDINRTVYVDESRLVKKAQIDTQEFVVLYDFDYIYDDLEKDWFKIDAEQIPCADNRNFTETPIMKFCYFMDMNVREIECTASVDITKKIGDEKAVPYKIYIGTKRGEIMIAEENLDKSYKRVLRTDLMDEYGMFPIFIGSDSKCEYVEGNPNSVTEVMLEDIPVSLMTKTEFFYKESVGCLKDKKCIKYCVDDFKKVCVTLLDSEEHYPVEYVNGNVTITFGALEYDIDTSEFELDNKEYPGCSEDHPEAYKKPKNFCEHISLKTAHFPCSFAINVTRIEKEKGYGSESGSITESTTDIFCAKATPTIGIYTFSDAVSDTAYVIRGDLAEKPGEIPVARGSSQDCGCMTVEESSVETYMKSYLEGLFYGYTSIEYDEVTKTTIDEIEYNKYTLKSGVQEYTVYVNKKGFITRAEYFDDSSSRVEIFNYSFYNLDANMFKLDSATFGTCSIPGFNKAPENITYCKSVIVPDPFDWRCAFSVKITGETKAKTETLMYYFAKDAVSDSLIVGVETINGSKKSVLRGDLVTLDAVGDPLIPGFMGTTEDPDKCSLYRGNYYSYSMMLSEYFDVYLKDEFVFETKKDVVCGKDMCTMYCNDAAVCVTLRNTAPGFIVYYESKTKNITYEFPKEITDMEVFALDNKKFPGCAKEAYEKPEVICQYLSSSSSSSSDTNKHSSSPSSSASTIDAAVSIIVVVLALFLF